MFRSDYNPAVAQGIVAQVRILGGSLGIAASTAILGATKQRELNGIVSEEQVARLKSSTSTLSPAQRLAIRVAYSDAFNETLLVCAIIAGVCVLVTLGTFRRHPQDLAERRQEQLVNHERDMEAQAMRSAGLQSGIEFIAKGSEDLEAGSERVKEASGKESINDEALTPTPES